MNKGKIIVAGIGPGSEACNAYQTGGASSSFFTLTAYE